MFSLTYHENRVEKHVGNYATQEEAMRQIPAGGFAPDGWELVDGMLVNVGEDGDYSISGPVSEIARDTQKTPTVSVHYLGDKFDVIDDYATTEEAIGTMLEMAWEDPESVGFAVKDIVTGRILATLVTEEKFDDCDGIVVVCRYEGHPTMSRYAVSYELDADDGHYVSTNIRKLS